MQLNLLLSRLYNLLKERKIFLVYVPLTIYWVFLFIATTIPTDAIPRLFNAQDKLEHFSAYFILSVLLLLTLHFQDKYELLRRNAYLSTFLLLALYGAVDEFHQYLIPGRYCDFYDWTADVFGGVIGIILMFVFIKRITPSQ